MQNNAQNNTQNAKNMQNAQNNTQNAKNVQNAQNTQNKKQGGVQNNVPLSGDNCR